MLCLSQLEGTPAAHLVPTCRHPVTQKVTSTQCLLTEALLSLCLKSGRGSLSLNLLFLNKASTGDSRINCHRSY